MDRETTLLLMEQAAEAMRQLSEAYDRGELPTDLFDDLDNVQDAYNRMASLANLLFAYRDDEDRLEKTEIYEPAVQDACGWPERFDDEEI